VAFKAMKGKYQTRLRSHFRFRTLRAILLECYALLPPLSLPPLPLLPLLHGSHTNGTGVEGGASAGVGGVGGSRGGQQVFVEALRVFRDR
jgi:hypothetical protein